MYRERTLESFVKTAVGQFPVLMVTGARQVGKTTFLRHLSGEARKYVTLDDPLVMSLAKEDPALFMQRFPPPVLIDEIQYAGASYLGYLLQPWFKNYGKRISKTPKFYFLDPALPCYFTRQPDADSTLAGAMGGALFEGFIVSEAVKAFASVGRKADIFFWRSHDGLEVDLIVQAGAKLYPVEIKLTATPAVKHLEPLNRFREIAGRDAADNGLLVCRVQKEMPLPSGNKAIPWQDFAGWLRTIL